MKYISRLLALLLAMTLLWGSALAELTLDGLTQGQLDALYASVADETETLSVTGVLAATEAISGTEVQGWAAQGYALQWYTVDDEGARTALNGETADSLTVTYMLEVQQFVCIAVDGTGLEYVSPVYAVAAQTSDMEAYLDYLYYEDQFYTETDELDKQAVYNHLTGVWDVDVDGVNLATTIVAAWWAEQGQTWFDASLLCSCVVSGAAAGEACMLHPDADHDASCGWYEGAPVLKLTAETDESGSVVRYLLTATVDGESVVIAHTEMLDGVRHYFKDNATGLFVAWLQTDENGVQWIIPLESESN